MHVFDPKDIQPLLDAAARSDGEACKLALSDIALGLSGDHWLVRGIQLARRRAKPIPETQIAPFHLPVDGLLPGSTLAKPKLAA